MYKIQNTPILTFSLFYSTLQGFNSSGKLVRINTLYWGQCFLITPVKHEKSPTQGTDSALILNLKRNNSFVWLYLLPNEGKSVNSAAVDEWIYEVDPFELQNDNFLRLTISKEFHVRRSTQASPCTHLEEATYYEASFQL